MTRSRFVWFVVSFCALIALALARLVPYSRAARATDLGAASEAEAIRRALFKEIQPIRLANCELKRFGEPHDGGYLMCDNLLGAVRAGYSYGISGYDGWGCDISRKLGIGVHQYDCFNLTRPVCEGGLTNFHGECIAAHPKDEDGRRFDTLGNQIARNHDFGARLVVKMDVEGAEWDSFIHAPDDVLRRIDQLQVEFHGFDQVRYINAVRRLKQFFHVAHLHWNNYACVDDKPPFPAWAYEILFVNKRIAQPAPGAHLQLPHALDAPNNPIAPECPR
jgi:hypothetical protein